MSIRLKDIRIPQTLDECVAALRMAENNIRDMKDQDRQGRVLPENRTGWLSALAGWTQLREELFYSLEVLKTGEVPASVKGDRQEDGSGNRLHRSERAAYVAHLEREVSMLRAKLATKPKENLTHLENYHRLAAYGSFVIAESGLKTLLAMEFESHCHSLLPRGYMGEWEDRHLPFIRAHIAARQTLATTRRMVCPACHGKGHFGDGETCRFCGGEGSR